jgi:murein DD-endopeptidase MepM/ murein hydrolase activator NlpD
MKRLVYSPSVKAWVKSDTGVIDLSPYITDCMVHRVIDDVSKLELTFRNPKISDPGARPKFMFTEHEVNGQILPVFHPMDPITVVFERIAGKPIQVFTGYCDTTPYVQLFPGVAKIKASCTLKRLQYTYWDPALPFVNDFMKSYGWVVNPNSGQTSPTTNRLTGLENQTVNQSTTNIDAKFNDSSIGNLLYAVVNEIGGWNDSNIYIQPLPNNIVSTVYKLFNEFTAENERLNTEIKDFLEKLVGSGSFGTASAGGTNNSNSNDAGNPSGHAASVGYPLAIKGQLIGGSNVPGSTHDPNSPPNNWQSDNALDIGVPVGTGVFAVDDGTITTVRGTYTNGSGRFEGLRFTLETADNKWFYQHNSARYVTEGQKVKKGDLLAKSGAGNGVPHLHIGCQTGKPEKLLGWE